jgi:hypothetical protein
MITKKNDVKNRDEKPYGSIGGMVKTEWGYLFNIKQYLS